MRAGTTLAGRLQGPVYVALLAAGVSEHVDLRPMHQASAIISKCVSTCMLITFYRTASSRSKRADALIRHDQGRETSHP